MSLPIVYHIHTNLVFAEKVQYFPDKDFDNRYIVITNTPEKVAFELKASIYKCHQYVANTIIRKLSDADFVVLYDLDYIKSYIANRVSNKVIILWRFFGHELYRQPFISNNNIYSEYDLPFINSSFKRKKTPMMFMSKLFHIFDPNAQIEFEKAINRINFFFGLSQEEYTYLNKYIKLPPFIIIPRSSYSIEPLVKKNNTIILGNNRSAFNNHLEIYNYLRQINEQYLSAYRFKLLFNYGSENEYTNKVVESFSSIKSVSIIKDYLPYNKFLELYDTAAALVINGYRQMAMANIMAALRKGTKVYLNTKNSIYDWAINEDFKVYNIESLPEDLKRGSVQLSKEEIDYNRNIYLELRNKYSTEKFINDIGANKYIL